MKTAERKRIEIQTWLDGLRWDGTPRCHEFMACGLGSDHNPSASVWFFSAAINTIITGEVDDWEALNVYGPQGCGKSQAFKALFGKWWSEVGEELGDAKTYRAAVAGHWMAGGVRPICGAYDRLAEGFHHTRFIYMTNNQEWSGGAIEINPLSVDGVNWIKENRKQLFAEAMAWRPA